MVEHNLVVVTNGHPVAAVVPEVQVQMLLMVQLVAQEETE
tara:strand:- start:89 stop:208 length:120 start_codon:yes stop_codon:yes gene_type:complete